MCNISIPVLKVWVKASHKPFCHKIQFKKYEWNSFANHPTLFILPESIYFSYMVAGISMLWFAVFANCLVKFFLFGSSMKVVSFICFQLALFVTKDRKLFWAIYSIVSLLRRLTYILLLCDLAGLSVLQLVAPLDNDGGTAVAEDGDTSITELVIGVRCILFRFIMVSMPGRGW